MTEGVLTNWCMFTDRLCAKCKVFDNRIGAHKKGGSKLSVIAMYIIIMITKIGFDCTVLSNTKHGSLTMAR